MTNSPITLRAIIKSVRAKTGMLAQNPQQLVDLIRDNHLSEAIAGTHDGKPVTFARAYELVTGERLTLKRAS
jgi:hypothetical protein